MLHAECAESALLATHLFQLRLTNGMLQRALARYSLNLEPVTLPTEIEETLPLFAESVTVASRKVTTGRVRVRVSPQLQEQSLPIALSDQKVTVERVPIGRFVETAPDVRVEGDTTILPVLEERAVVTVKLFLLEEVHVRAVRTTHREQRSVSLRQDTVTVERTPTDHAPPEQGNTDHE